MRQGRLAPCHNGASQGQLRYWGGAQHGRECAITGGGAAEDVAAIVADVNRDRG
jgi:hypothetical protein